MLKFLGIDHFDDFGDMIVFWVEIQNAPVEIQNKARVIDEENYLENAFGICVQYDLANNEFRIVTDNDCNIYYTDNHGEKHWFEIDINEDFKHLIFKECNQEIERTKPNKDVYILVSCNEWKEHSSMNLIMATTDPVKLNTQIGKEIKCGNMNFLGEQKDKAYDMFNAAISDSNKETDFDNLYSNLEYGHVKIVEDR